MLNIIAVLILLAIAEGTIQNETGQPSSRGLPDPLVEYNMCPLPNQDYPFNTDMVPSYCVCLHCQGPKGDMGPKGEKGNFSPPGKPGPSGVKGIKGSRGPQGPRGFRGIKGQKGARGPRGMMGLKGIRGRRGFPGRRGLRGNPGMNGLPGLKGDAGVAGQCPTDCRSAKGDKGQKGETGFHGPKGDTGGVGLVGQPGLKGDPGSIGQKGDKGDEGTKGSQGIPGICDCKDGEQGERGETGPMGPKGTKGDHGPMGEQGQTGEKGVKVSSRRIAQGKMSNPQLQKDPVPSVVVTKMMPPPATLKNIVFKKTTCDKAIAVYLGKRDFVDHVSHTDPVDGVLVLDTGYIKDRKVFCRLLCAFRYGREDIDVCGLKFRRDLYMATIQVYPPPSGEKPKPQTKLQERLARKFGDRAYPFCFQFPDYLPCSITLQLGPNEVDKCCGVDFQIIAFCAKTSSFDEKISKRSSVSMVIRKVQYAPDKPIFQPVAKTSRQFLMSDKPLHLEASLNKEIFYHGEPIQVNVEVINHSNKTVKKVKITADQISKVVLYSQDKYSQTVAEEEVNEQVSPGSTMKKVYSLHPIIANNREKHGLALDGKLRHEDTNLASTTILKEGIDREVWGILVSYKVRVKLIVSGMLGDVLFSDAVVELPFLLMHPPRETLDALMMTLTLRTLTVVAQWQ
ncbi:S-arrestin-like isoform X3 [Narcine bancroftii]|uniref:S-arrestin-like isoform X3 n=1 Tax=Narcine bancroftii TaxID=1343680 RepID=UPI00383231AE